MDFIFGYEKAHGIPRRVPLRVEYGVKGRHRRHCPGIVAVDEYRQYCNSLATIELKACSEFLVLKVF
jgi:hypothetical protein